MSELPKQLKADCILEAMAEIRFDVKEPTEVVIGRLLDCPLWSDYNKLRTPFSDIPVQLRLSDPNLRFQPLFELRSNDRMHVVKIGSHVLSIHNLRPYIGWPEFRPMLDTAFSFFFEKLSGVTLSRLGLRYVNATTMEDHKISSINDLNIDLTMGGTVIQGDFNINFAQDVEGNGTVMTRIATPRFVSGKIPKKATAFIDIDVFLESGAIASNAEEASAWIEQAHNLEKEQFFKLLPEKVIEALRED